MAKLGKASQDTYNRNWVAEVVAFEINAFIPDANQEIWLKETCKVSQVASFPVYQTYLDMNVFKVISL